MRFFNAQTLGILLFSFALSLLPPSSAQATSTNSLIKASGDAVYYLAEDGKRYVFPNQHIYLSWYADFNEVQTISDAQLATYPIGGNIFYRPGTRMVKITTDPKVYAVGPQGSLYPVASEQAAVDLFGTNWSTKIDDLPDAFFSGYTFESELNGTTHPPGTLFQYVGSNHIFYLDWAGTTPYARKITKEDYTAFRYNESFLITVPGEFNYSTGAIADVQIINRPAQLINEEFEPLPISVVGAISVVRRPDFTGAFGTVETTDATFYSLSIVGDAEYESTLTEIGIEFFIDAAGGDFEIEDDDDDEEDDTPDEMIDDFAQTIDIDGTIERAFTDIVDSIQLIHHETGDLLATIPRISSSLTKITLDEPIAPGEVFSIDLIGRIRTAPEGVRLAVDFPGSAIKITSEELVTLTRDIPDRFNGGISPQVITTPVLHGKLNVSSSITDNDSIYFLTDTINSYNLNFFAQAEDFLIDRVTVKLDRLADDYIALKDVQAITTKKSGELETKLAKINADIITFENLDLYVPAGSTIELPISLIPWTNSDEFSNSRIQMEFIIDNFSTETQISELEFTSPDFLHDDRLIDNTDLGGLTLLRTGHPSFARLPESPSGLTARFNQAPVLQFSITAEDDDIAFNRLTFELDTSDVEVEGPNNDMLESLLNIDDDEAGRLFFISESEGEIEMRGPTTTFTLVSKSKGHLTEPSDYESTLDDYGLLSFDFSPTPYRISKGNTLKFLLRLNTDTVSINQSSVLKLTLLGDDDSTHIANANFRWHESSEIYSTGYLVPGIPITNSLSFQRLTKFNP
jgi:hypothetical protein